MTEREMEDLLWEHPEKFLNEPLKKFQRQPASGVGRADLVFLDRLDRILVIELKRGTLQRGAVPQIVDYHAMLKSRFPEKSVELMIIANSIPLERRVSCEQHHIEAVEISEKKFRDVADETGYVFKSETANSDSSSLIGGLPMEARRLEANSSARRENFLAPLRKPRGLGTFGKAKLVTVISWRSSMPKEAVACGFLKRRVETSCVVSISQVTIRETFQNIWILR